MPRELDRLDLLMPEFMARVREPEVLDGMMLIWGPGKERVHTQRTPCKIIYTFDPEEMWMHVRLEASDSIATAHFLPKRYYVKMNGELCAYGHLEVPAALDAQDTLRIAPIVLF